MPTTERNLVEYDVEILTRKFHVLSMIFEA